MPSGGSKLDITTRFQKLITEFREMEDLDTDETRLTQRLVDNIEAAKRFAMVEDDSDIKRLLLVCVEADCLARTFRHRVEEARNTPRKSERYDRAISDIERLLKETQRPIRDRLAAYVLPDNDRIHMELQALASIQDRVRTQRFIAAQTLLRLGATRKCRSKIAAETAAIGWIADGVKRITKKTNARLCADLAELVLGCDVSLDRVHNAAETHERDWRAAS